MRLYVDAMNVETVRVAPERGGAGGTVINFDQAIKVWLTTEQATKLCFDLLALVPPVELAKRSAQAIADHMAAQ